MNISKNSHLLRYMVKDAIVQMITTEKFQENKLPAEIKLAERFGVSLAVIREALLLLQAEGVITKKHGSGNYFHLSALNQPKRVNQFYGFRQLLEAAGHRVSETIAHLESIKPEERICKALNLESDELVLSYDRQFFADGQPVIYCANWLPLKLFRDSPESYFTTAINIFDIFKKCFRMELAYGNLEFIPYLTTDLERKQICVDPGKPIIIMQETFYSLQDIPMAYSMTKFNHKYITLNLLNRQAL